ncbi:MAG: endolytic transglycosylase MltG [Ktedonobacteraceae bacterium]
MKRGPRFTIIAVLLVGAAIFGLTYSAWNTTTDIFQPLSPAGQGKQVSFEISPGESTARIAADLQAKGLIRNALAFSIWARIKGLDTHLEAGIYKTLNTSMTISDIIDKLLNAQPDAVRILILEGWRLEQLARQISSYGLVKFKSSEFLDYTRHIDKFPDAAKYPILQNIPQGSSMEGVLFPASYEIPVQATASDIIGLLLKTMTDTIAHYHLDTLAQQHNLSLYKMLTLASIVEREAGPQNDGTERGGIASVYWNRVYKQNDETVGLLQADPTVQYARDTQAPPTKYWQPLSDTGSKIATDSQWNTYVVKGFPPTPICSPGLASLQAAAAPPNTDYYFFLTKKDGHAVFAKTNAEFQQDEQKYLQ